MTCCLVIAFYIGNNTREQCSQAEKESYIEKQKKLLAKVKHNLDKIVFVFSSDSHTSDEIVVEDKEEENITYIHRKNCGFSFAAWKDVLNHYKDAYDYYILNEDDYMFIKDDFDSILIDEYKQKDVDYMVTYLNEVGAMSTVGIISKEQAEKHKYFTDIPFTNDKCLDMHAFFHSSFSICCISEAHNAFPYWGYEADQYTRKIALYGLDNMEETKETYQDRILLTCVQLLDEELEIDWSKDIYICQNKSWRKHQFSS